MSRLPTLAMTIVALTVGAPVANAQTSSTAPAPAPAPLAPAPSGATAGQPTPSAISNWAGQPTTLSLVDILAQAMKSLPALATAKFDAQIAQDQLDLASARSDWQIGADLQLSSNRTFFAGMPGTVTRATLGGFATKPLATGGAITVSAETNVTDNAFDAFDRRNWAHSVTGALTHPLMRGRGRAFFEIANRRAKLALEQADISHRAAAINAVQQVIAAYFDLVLAESEFAISKASLELANERLRVTKLAIDGKTLAPNEALPVEQAIATRQEEVLLAELNIVQRSIALRRAAGLPIAGGQLGLRVEANANVPAAPSDDIATLLEHAYAQSPELARLANSQANATLDVEIADNGLLPQLDAALTLGPTGTGDTSGGALKNLVTDPGVVIAGTLTFRRGLGQHDAKARQQLARHQRERITVSAIDIKAQISAALTTALGQLQLANARVELADRTIALAKKSIDNEVARVSLGKSTNFDVLQRQDELRFAEQRRARAVIDSYKSITTVQALTGELLPFWGVSATASAAHLGSQPPAVGS